MKPIFSIALCTVLILSMLLMPGCAARVNKDCDVNTPQTSHLSEDYSLTQDSNPITDNSPRNEEIISLNSTSGEVIDQTYNNAPNCPGFWEHESLALVGSGIPGVSQWNPADPAGDMERANHSYVEYEKILPVTAGTVMTFKIVANDEWDPDWTFGAKDIVLGQKVALERSVDSPDLQLSMDEDCLLRFIVDLAPVYSDSQATLLVEKVIPPTLRRVSVFAPSAWEKIYAHTKQSEALGPFPGTLLPEIDYYNDIMIPIAVTDLTLSSWTCDGELVSIEGIPLEDNLRDVLIFAEDDGSYSIYYERIEERSYHVRGDEDWMSPWNLSSDAGRLVEISFGVYQRTFEDVPPGSYWFTIARYDRWNNITHDCTDDTLRFELPQACDVTVTYTLLDGKVAIALDNKPLRSGDVTTDGKLNIGDVSRLYSKIRGSTVLTEVAAMKNADFNSDGNLNLGDVARLYSYIRGTDPAFHVDTAYDLPLNQEMVANSTLTGTVLRLIKPYHPKDRTVILDLIVPGREDYPVRCSISTDTDLTYLYPQDKVTVKGRLHNFYSTIAFKDQCELLNWTDIRSTEEDMEAIIDQVFDGQYYAETSYPMNFTAQVGYVQQSYEYSNAIDVMLTLESRPYHELYCWGLTGDLVDQVMLGSTVTIQGTLISNYGSPRFEDNCELIDIFFDINVEQETDPLKLIDMAAALDDWDFIPYPVTLEGKIVDLWSIYDEEDNSMFVVMAVPGRENIPIRCAGMKGAQVGNHLCVGDTIAVIGILQGNGGNVQFDSGCQMTDWKPCGVSKPADPKQIVDEAFALDKNEMLPYIATLTGKVKYVDTYDDVFKTRTVTMTVQGTSGSRDIVCTWLRGTGVDQITEGDTITVTGIIEYYIPAANTDSQWGYIQFSDCILENIQ